MALGVAGGSCHRVVPLIPAAWHGGIRVPVGAGCWRGLSRQGGWDYSRSRVSVADIDQIAMQNSPYGIPLLGFAAFSGTGKTTLLEKLIPLLGQAGLRIALIKHAHHDFDTDQPGKDSYRLRKAGAGQVLLASDRRRVLITELPEPVEPGLGELLAQLDRSRLDLVLVEGFRHLAFPKIELHRPALGRPLLFPDDPHILAVASDAVLSVECPLPLLDLNEPLQIQDFIVRKIALGD